MKKQLFLIFSDHLFRNLPDPDIPFPIALLTPELPLLPAEPPRPESPMANR
jgi:hypothetical protein